KKGQVVIFFRGETLRLDVDQHLGGPSQPLGKAGWTVHVKDFSADADPHAKGAVPSFPIVFLELSRAGGGEPVQVAAMARRVGGLLPLKPRTLPAELDDLKVYYHPPDYRWGEESIRAILQFVTGQDGKLYYRSFHSGERGLALEKPGEATQSDASYPVW